MTEKMAKKKITIELSLLDYSKFKAMSKASGSGDIKIDARQCVTGWVGNMSDNLCEEDAAVYEKELKRLKKLYKL